jgi:SPP1 gp7 family putative phage head morphogenesis protein
MGVYDKGFTVNVPTSKIPAYYDGEGNVIREVYERAAYSYEIPPDVYAEIVSRTENARWFNEGTLNGYANSKVVEEVEILTAGDERVCDLCLSHEGEVIPLEEAKGVLPRHPLCRCSFLPIISISNEDRGIIQGAKNLLMNQSVLSGVNNLIKSESAWALKNIAEKVSVKNIEPQIFKSINQRIKYNLELEGNYFPSKLSSIKTVNTEENVMEMIAEKDQLKIGLMRSQKAIDDTWEYNKAFFKRTGRPWGADYWVGEAKSVDFIVDHELGHLLMNKIYLKNVDLMAAWETIYDGMSKKQIKAISETATENINEFFAETYALYLHGKKKILPKSVIEFFDNLELDIK